MEGISKPGFKSFGKCKTQRTSLFFHSLTEIHGNIYSLKKPLNQAAFLLDMADS